MKLGLLFEVC